LTTIWLHNQLYMCGFSSVLNLLDIAPTHFLQNILFAAHTHTHTHG